jgi:hypothetical protein
MVAIISPAAFFMPVSRAAALPLFLSWRITFTHPVSQKSLKITAPCPDDLKQLHEKIEENFVKEVL